MQTHPVSVAPCPTIYRFVPCPDGVPDWRCPNCGGCGGHQYAEEVVAGECITNALKEDKHNWSFKGWDKAQV